MGSVEPLYDGEVVGDTWPLLAEGEYSAVVTHHETALSWGRRPKLYLHFRIVEPGPYNGARLIRAYRLAEVLNKPKRGGRFKVRRGSDLYLMLARVLGRDMRPDRVTLAPLRKLVVRVKVRTVTKDHRQRELPEMVRYSVVDDVIDVEAGNADA